jgi:hypothetical protein
MQDSSPGVVAPVVLDEDGEMEDSARYFPTPLKILYKEFGKCKFSYKGFRDIIMTSLIKPNVFTLPI